MVLQAKVLEVGKPWVLTQSLCADLLLQQTLTEHLLCVRYYNGKDQQKTEWLDQPREELQRVR